MEYIITTPCGDVRGVATRREGIIAYKGIRYATAGRFECPKEVTHWDGVYDAAEYGACAYQPRAFYNEEDMPKKVFYYNEFRRGESYTYSEDCLFLNVFAPEKTEERLPVIIYIHGGGYTGGCGHEKHFDEPVWPTKGVIGVTINYRLGPMGFVCLPELEEEAGFTGNYGLFDQLAALNWVHDNIAAFGGDPDRITIMGQSAGAMSVQQHCLSPLGAGLYQGAVMSSGGGVSKMLCATPAKTHYDYWKTAMAKAGCDTLEQFRAVSPETLFQAWEQTKKELRNPGCFPCIDGRFVVGAGADLLAEGKQKKISYLLGTTSEDMMPPILLDMSKKWCAAQENHGYCWYFERKLPGDDNGAWHSSDLWYWFGTLDNCWRPMEEKDRALSEQMVNYLCNFLATGDPNGEDLPQWTLCDKQGKVLRLGQKDTAMGKPSKLKMFYTMLTNKAVGE